MQCYVKYILPLTLSLCLSAGDIAAQVPKSKKTGQKKVVQKKVKYDSVGEYYRGYASVKKNGKYGCIDGGGKLVVPCVYDVDVYLQNGFAQVQRDRKKGIVDSTGKETVPCVYDEMHCQIEASIYQWDELIIVTKDQKWGTIDKYNHVLTPMIYSKIDYNSAVVYGSGRIREVVLDDKVGYIDRVGNKVIEPVYDELVWLGHCCFEARKAQKYGLVGRDGSLILPLDYYGMGPLANGMVSVMNKKSNWGFADTLGRLRIPCKYDEQSSFRNGIAKVLLEGKLFYINRKGEVMHTPE